MELLIIIVLCQPRLIWKIKEKNSQANTVPISKIICSRVCSFSPANDRRPALTRPIDGIYICLTLISNRNPKRAYARTTIAYTHHMFLFLIRLSTTYGLRCQFFLLQTCISILFSVHSLQHSMRPNTQINFSFGVVQSITCDDGHSISFGSLIPFTSK